MNQEAAKARAGELFDYLMLNPGVTTPQMCEDLGWDMSLVRQAIRHVRLDLAGMDVNLTCVQEGRGYWKYTLVSSRDDHSQWLSNRTKDARARLETVDAIMRSVVNATDGRKAEGRHARRTQATIAYLITQMDAAL